MKRVFKWLTKDGGHERANVYASWFARVFEPNDFDGIDRMLYCYIAFCSKLSITPTKTFLNAYLKVDGKEDIKKHNIRTETMESLDYREASQLEESCRIITELTNSVYDSYCTEDLTDRDFKVDMYSYMSSRKSDRIQNEMMKAYPKLMDGSNVTDVSSELRSNLSKLDTVYNTNRIREVDCDSTEEDVNMKFLCSTGLPCIDGDIGGIYTRLIYTINGQPGSGKTRLACAYFAYPILTVAKKDVLYYATELTASQIKNILIAHHIVHVYNGRIKIPDSIMNKPEEMTAEQKQIYESAKIDLLESGKYGKIIIKEACVIEQYTDEVLSVEKASGNLGAVIIDYMGLVRSKPLSRWDGFSAKYEIITEAYEQTRDILKSMDISSICLNQYNDKGIENAYAGKQIRPGDVQGGHIVQRHTDYDLSMTMTEEQELSNVRCLSVTKKRAAKGFKNVLLSVDLAVSLFKQRLSV